MDCMKGEKEVERADEAWVSVVGDLGAEVGGSLERGGEVGQGVRTGAAVW